MDGKRFDEWTTAMASTRRGALRLIVGGTLGAALTRLGVGEAAAACRIPGRFCDKKADKCCGGAKCKGGRCRCKGAVGCGKKCCAPGQICVKGAGCQNGPLEPGDTCNPNKPQGCQSGTCSCISNDELGTVCTCRQESCLGLNNQMCTKTSQCCQGGCDGFTEKCQVID